MGLICPVCEKEVDAEPIDIVKEVKIRGEIFKVPVRLYKCLECGYNQIEDLNNPQDELDAAFREYRKKYGMLQPEEIRSIRKKYNLTQQELAKLLGISPATLSRYENGGLQEAAHDRLLQFISEPENMLSLVNKNKGILPDNKVKTLEKTILQTIDDRREYDFLEKRHNFTMEKYRGKKSFSFPFFENFIAYIINKVELMGNTVTKTKLNKLLFYIDFLSYRELGHSLTGAVYVKLPYGPCPDGFQMVLDIMEKNGTVSIIERYLENSDAVTYIIHTGNRFYNIQLSDDEKEIVDFVVKNLGNKRASELSEMSHKEKAYIDSTDTGKIDYAHADFLNLTLFKEKQND